MKALSVRQPWAWLLIRPDVTDPAERAALYSAGLIKDIENRNWRTRLRGRIWIHASLGMTQEQYFACRTFVQERFGETIKLPRFDELERGGIIGSAEIVGCVEQSSSPWFVGEYGFELANARPRSFTPCRGELSFFTPKRPEEAKAAKVEKFPRLSETLPCPRVVGSCQGCGRTKEQLREAGVDLITWIECNDHDQPTHPRVYVQLCTACDGVDADGQPLPFNEVQPGRPGGSVQKTGLIERHPRLYQRAIHNFPSLGAMDICVGCKWAQELRCACPRSKANGGEGILIEAAKPQVMFLDGTRGGRRVGWQSTTYAYPPRSCAGRETYEVAE